MNNTHKWIKDREGYYSVDTAGYVYSHNKDGRIKHIGIQDKAGYVRVKLTKNKNIATRTVMAHILVAETFIPNPDGLPNIDHIDENKSNNAVSNLRWCTPKQNSMFYVSKDGHQGRMMMLQSRIDKLERIKKEQTKQIAKALAEVRKLKKQLALDKKRFETQRAKAIELLQIQKQKYDGPKYTDVTGMKFESFQKMVELTGKPITVDQAVFNSCGSAAAYIVEQEAAKGSIRNKDTISKELRRYLKSSRTSLWKMYGVYEISTAV